MILVFLGLCAVLLLACFAREAARLRTIPRLAAPDAALPAPPLVSVLIPARNEAHTIARCLDGVLAQEYPAYEIIVVDDSSTDSTGEILARYAQQHAHVRVLNSGGPPPGWTGKAHACQQAAAAARGEWLLFLDADTVPLPGLIAALLDHSRRQQFDLLTVFPFLELESFWERAVLPPFRAILHATYPFKRLNAPDVRPDEVAANGQCILFRSAAYHAIGGHGAVRADVLEDVHLARAVRTAGYRTGAVEGSAYLRVRMYTNRYEVFEGLTKNAAAGYTSGGTRAFWVGAYQFMLAFAPFWLLAAGLVLLAQGRPAGWAALGLGLLVAGAALTYWILLMRTIYRLPGSTGLLWPFGLVCYGIIAARSLWQVRSGRGVTWKGRRYAGT
jgi:glycosyltransferase involved in cell wall biosynthesis